MKDQVKDKHSNLIFQSSKEQKCWLAMFLTGYTIISILLVLTYEFGQIQHHSYAK